MAAASLQRRFNLTRFFQGEAPQAPPYVLRQRNVYILPTGRGLMFAVTLLIMLLGAMNYSNSLGYLLTFLLGSVAVVTILHTYRNLLHLRVRVGAIEPAFQGNAVAVPVILDNGGHGRRFSVEVFFPGQPAQVTDVPTGQHATVIINAPAGQRGYRPLPRFTLSSRFPLGLFRAWSHVVLDHQYLVYPAPAPPEPLPPRSLYVASALGDQGIGSDDFAGLRRFRSGDSLKHVHWKALARQQGLLTKQFGGDRSEQIWLDWRMLEGHDREQRLSRLCRWVIEAQRQNTEYGLWLPDQAIAPARDIAHYHQCLKALGLFGTQ
jgi:uncharacterized protein (DUF58 family)